MIGWEPAGLNERRTGNLLAITPSERFVERFGGDAD
jgi:hypothetical protein